MARHLIARARQMRREPTEAERRLWSKLRNYGLGVRFVRQRPIGPYIADFACRAAKLVVELDGGQHGAEYYQRRDAYWPAMDIASCVSGTRRYLRTPKASWRRSGSL